MTKYSYRSISVSRYSGALSSSSSNGNVGIAGASASTVVNSIWSLSESESHHVFTTCWSRSHNASVSEAGASVTACSYLTDQHVVKKLGNQPRSIASRKPTTNWLSPPSPLFFTTSADTQSCRADSTMRWWPPSPYVALPHALASAANSVEALHYCDRYPRRHAPGD